MSVAAHGLAVRPPAGWDVRIYRRRPAAMGETTHPVLHAATIRLPADRADYGSNVVASLGPDDAFVALLEFGADAVMSALFAPQGLPQLRAGDFSSKQLHRSILGQSGAQVFFHVGTRAFCLYAVLGAHSRRLFTAPHVQRLVGAISVDG
jgi:predicted RNase H-like nuclease